MSGMDNFVHEKGGSFLPLPEISQIELTNRCNLKCPMCLRTTDMVRPADLLDPALLRTMHARGDFGGSYYVELQMAGEPTLHPELESIIEFLHSEVGVLVGLSTHGLLIRKRESLADVLLGLDALTISVDSTVPEAYAQMRFPAQLPQLYESLDILFTRAEKRKEAGLELPFIELQLVEYAGVEGSGDLPPLLAVMKERGWDRYAVARVQQDCFTGMQGRESVIVPNERLCINPFTSVSIAQNGDVLSCCYIFDPNRDEANWYGNVNDSSLADIWDGERVSAMRESHIGGCMPDQCAKCTFWSPARIHLNIVSRLIRHRRTRR